jgi:hypothetical protein
MVSSTSFIVDGADITSEGGFEGMQETFKIPPDAIAEFKMEATNGSAEYGRSAGGSASFQIKSGSNQIHGSGYEYVRNTALDARGFFSPQTPVYKHNEFGANAGGAIIKNKAFVFGYYNGFRLVQAASSNTATIPTAEMDQGNFTNYGYCSDNEINACAANPGAWVQTQLLDPTNGKPNGPLVNGNIINPVNFDPVSQKVLQVIASKNVVPNVGNSPRDIFNNFTSPVANTLRVDEWGVKGDYVFNDKSRIGLTYLTGKSQTPNVPSIPAPLGGGDQPSYNQTRNVRLNWSYSLRPNMINQATLSLNQLKSGTQPVTTYAGNSDWAGFLGIKGVTPNYPTEWPQIVINQQSWNGGGGAGFSNDHSSGINDSFSWVTGKHTLKFGFQYLRGADNSVSTGNSAGYFNFLNQETGLQSAPNTTGIADASFLLGLADEGRTYVFTTPAYSRTTYGAGFAQDDYKITKKLTANLGVRWDLFKPVTHKYFDKDWVNPAAFNPALSAPNIPGVFQRASATNTSGMNTYYRNFSPRIGLAYSLNDKTVVRAAYGIFYAQGNGDRVDGGSTVMGFNQTLSSGTGVVQADGITAPGFTWGTQSLPAFTPPSPASFGPLGQLGKGVARHSAGTLISVDPTDSMAPYAQNYTLSVQRQLPSSMVLTVAFVGNEGTHTASRLTSWDKLPPKYLHLQDALNVNLATPASQAIPEIAALPIDPNTGNHSPFQGFEALYGGAGILPAGSPPGTSGNTAPVVGQALIENPQYTGLHRYYEALGVSNYDALQVKLDKRFSNGLTLLVSYAWSKTLTDGGSIFSTFSSEFYTTTPYNRHDQKSYSYEDVPSNLAIAYVYELPFGKGRKYLHQGGIVNAVLGGWKTSGILRYQSGLPMSFEVGDTFFLWEDHGWQEPNTVPGVRLASAAKLSGGNNFDPAKDSMFNVAALQQPAPWTYGTQTPTEATVRGFTWPNEDVSLMKEWKLYERFELQFNADFFNVFNRHVFGENQGGYANEPGIGPGSGGVGGTINNPRVAQFGMRLKW